MITIGSNTQAVCIPKSAKIKTAANKKNLGLLNLLLAESLNEECFVSRPAISIIVPNGHTQPQKNLPNINASKTIIREKIIPERISL
jgi:hypothetical protein